MSFLHPWFLVLAVLPLAYISWVWQGSARRWGLVLKALSLSAIMFALSEPVLTIPETKTATVVLVDTSDSISSDDLVRASAVVNEIEKQRGRNWVRVVPFARRIRPLTPEEISGKLSLRRASFGGDATDIETALNESIAAIPPGYLPHVVVISDGNENQGSTARAIAQIERLHIPVDTIPLSGRSEQSIELASIATPHDAYAGEQIPIDLSIDAPRPVRATIEIFAEGKPLGSQSVQLNGGLNAVRVHARVDSSGATAISGVIRTEQLGEAHFDRAVELQRAKVLYLSQDPAGSEQNLLGALKQADFDVTTDLSLIAGGLKDIQLVILNNLDLQRLSPEQKTELEQFVNNGGGLLLIGGERQVYKDDKQMDALDRILPAKLVPPKTPEGICVALIIDKSSSMEGRKIELARLSASGVVDHLRASDTIGVLIFDNSFEWAVPMRRANDKGEIKRMISGITPDGGTQIAPALSEAYRKVSASNANSKHIVLLTDGISEEGDSLELSHEALLHQVTISTVGLGQDVNRSYLEKVAAESGGKSYFLNEPQGLEQILLKDVEEYTGKTAVEKQLRPLVRERAEILDGIDIASAPPLKGYARFSAKPGAETVLAINEEKQDPLYVRWEYGLGRSAVFSSDAKSRWAEQWITWKGYDKFWINVTRDLLSHNDQTEASAEFDSASGDLLVTYRLAANAVPPRAIPGLYVIGPNGFQRSLRIERVAERIYRGRLHQKPFPGLFRIRPVDESKLFPEVGVYAENQEAGDRGTNENLLRVLASATGGRFNPQPAAVLDSQGRMLYERWEVWPVFLALAIVLSLAELISRKWVGLRQGVIALLGKWGT